MENHDINNEASVGIYISTFLGTVALFFAGILLSRLGSFDKSLKMPILYLIVATFGFVFSAIVYANMTGSTRLGQTKGREYIRIGNVLSEYLGLYPFIASIPMAVSAITSDSFLRISTLILTLISIFLYSVSSFSLVGRGFKQVGVMIFTVFGCLSLLVSFIYQHQSNIIFNANGAMFLIILAVVAIIHHKKV